MTTPDALEAIIARITAEPVTPELEAMAAAVAARHGRGVAAVIAYGSALRGVAADETLIDLYVLTDDLAGVSRNGLARLGCRLAPPNVLYAETGWRSETLRCKYAVVPLDLFARKMAPDVSNPYFWARFAQPCRIVVARDAASRAAVHATLAQAVRTMITASLALAEPGDGPRELWQRGLAESYRTEFRPESADRAGSIVAAHAPYYEAVTEVVLGPGWTAPGAPTMPAAQRLRRRTAGKALSAVRLVKAGFTFEGGADYLAWKIARHSGLAIDVKPWQRRHPVLGALWLLPVLLRRGAVR